MIRLKDLSLPLQLGIFGGWFIFAIYVLTFIFSFAGALING